MRPAIVPAVFLGFIFKSYSAHTARPKVLLSAFSLKYSAKRTLGNYTTVINGWALLI
jgi:hypothetical protein